MDAATTSATKPKAVTPAIFRQRGTRRVDASGVVHGSGSESGSLVRDTAEEDVPPSVEVRRWLLG